MPPRLLTIPISHYCEKARWALDRAGIEYIEERHVQGVHRIASRRAGGKGTVPVLVTADGSLGESEEILRYADERLDDEWRLFPPDPALRAEVVALSRWLDQGLGPDGRRVMYALMLPHKRELLRFNNQGVPGWEGRAMDLLWPLARRWAARELSIEPDTVRDDTPRVRSAFDRVADLLADGRPFLFGERFSAADLTFACLAAAVVVPPEYGVRLPRPAELPRDIARQIESFRDHPAGAYALELFRTERRAPEPAAAG